MRTSSTDDFTRTQQGIERGVSTGSTLLDRAFKIPLGGSLLIKGEHHAGASALAFELTKKLRDMEIPVLFIDVADSWQDHRTDDIDRTSLGYVRPFSIDDIMETAMGFQELPRVAFVLDGPNLLAARKDTRWSSLKDLHHVAKVIRKLYSRSECTIVYTQHEKTQSQGMWNSIVDISAHTHEYEMGVGTSHLLKIDGPFGSTNVMVEYKRGRLSKAFEEATLQVEDGTDRGGTFIDPDTGEKTRGFHQYVRTKNSALKGALDRER